MTYNKRQFMILNVEDLDKVNFDEVMETSKDTVRKSIDGTRTFLKWDGDVIPLSIQALTTKAGPYTYEEILGILNTDEWKSKDTGMMGKK